MQDIVKGEGRGGPGEKEKGSLFAGVGDEPSCCAKRREGWGEEAEKGDESTNGG
jgi:hypothetical protein